MMKIKSLTATIVAVLLVGTSSMADATPTASNDMAANFWQWLVGEQQQREPLICANWPVCPDAQASKPEQAAEKNQ